VCSTSFNTWKEIEVKLVYEHLQEHVPKLVETTHEGKLTILWNQQVQTDRSIFDSKPEIIIRDNGNGIYKLIAVTILVDRNVI
jgi:hypothetical protein